jgi:hypothetical protein
MLSRAASRRSSSQACAQPACLYLWGKIVTLQHCCDMTGSQQMEGVRPQQLKALMSGLPHASLKLRVQLIMHMSMKPRM